LLEIYTGLLTWLGIHFPNQSRLIASGELVDDPRLPHLLGFGGEWKTTHAVILVEQDSLAALARPPDQAAPLEDLNRLGQGQLAFELYVRQFGPGDHAAKQLLQSIHAWDQAGRPQSSRLRLRALPAWQEVRLAEGEFLLDRPYTKFIVSYQPG
jgi:hypothetical protein